MGRDRNCYLFGSLGGNYVRTRASRTVWITFLSKIPYFWLCNVPVKSKLKHPPPRANPGHLTSFPTWEGGNLIYLVFPGTGIWSLLIGVGNLIASLDFMLRVALIPWGVINHGEDKPSCIQSRRYPIRGGLAEKQRLAQAFFCIWRYSGTIYIIFGM